MAKPGGLLRGEKKYFDTPYNGSATGRTQLGVVRA